MATNATTTTNTNTNKRVFIPVLNAPYCRITTVDNKQVLLGQEPLTDSEIEQLPLDVKVYTTIGTRKSAKGVTQKFIPLDVFNSITRKRASFKALSDSLLEQFASGKITSEQYASSMVELQKQKQAKAKA